MLCGEYANLAHDITTITLTTTKVTLTFHSDVSVTKGGFHLTYFVSAGHDTIGKSVNIFGGEEISVIERNVSQ